MSDLLKKFGMFDIMGIWAPGSISLLYILLTLVCIHNIDVISIVKEIQYDFSLMFIFFFCIFAYFLGVVFHEIGKGINDLKQPFTFHTLLKLRNKEHPNIFIKRFIALTNIECCVFENLNMNIYNVLESIKRKNTYVSSIEKVRSIFGFSRSVMISFIIHIMLLCIYTYNSYAVNVTFWIIDAIFIVLFLFRTIRYYYIWIQKTLNCYAVVMKEEQQNESDQTTKINI